MSEYANSVNYFSNDAARIVLQAPTGLGDMPPLPETGVGGGAMPAAAPMDPSMLPPNKILFCTNLPPETTQDMLHMLFAQSVIVDCIFQLRRF